MNADEARARIRALGFAGRDAETLFRHFDDAERRGKLGHGYSRIEWLETVDGIDPSARPTSWPRVRGSSAGTATGRSATSRWRRSATASSRSRRSPARVIVARDTFPTGMLGHYVRRLAVEAGLVALLTATSPPRLAHPDGGEPLVGTTPLAIGIPNPGRRAGRGRRLDGQGDVRRRPRRPAERRRTSSRSAASRPTRRSPSRWASSSPSMRAWTAATARCSSPSRRRRAPSRRSASAPPGCASPATRNPQPAGPPVEHLAVSTWTRPEWTPGVGDGRYGVRPTGRHLRDGV